MASEQYTHIEQDKQELPGGNDLPTYDDLANQNGPNSRFGRWKGWIEKRAAERYLDMSPQERSRRRERGWGNEDDMEDAEPAPSIVERPTYSGLGRSLHVDTRSLSLLSSPPLSPEDGSTLAGPLPFISQTIEPSHLKINHFGSRFLPHTTSQIRCTLPLLGNRMLLVGHDEGLSVFDMFPQEWTEDGEVITKGPDEAQCRHIWRGETVYQMAILEAEDTGSGTPQGVVLAVVGPSVDFPTPSKDAEAMRTARMYNLASLISLARWTIAQKGARPLDMHKMAVCQMPSTPSKRHRQQVSIARSIKSLIDSPPTQPPAEPTTSYQAFLSPTSTIGSSFARTPPGSAKPSPPLRNDSDDSTWDLVEDLPLRWAMDFVPLAAAGSRLAGASVLFFATWSDEYRKGKGTGGQLLAIATKSNILLYETPKGERAYRFVKEFYTPLPPRNVAFIQQSGTDVSRPSSEGSPGRFHSHKRSGSGGSIKVVNSATSSTPLQYGAHLSLFVVFDKKAGWIRLADSVVGEVELGDDGGPQPANLGHGGSGLSARDTLSSTTSGTASLRHRARLSFDIRESASKWIIPVRVELPIPGYPPGQGVTQPVHVLTKGKRTHIVPCPLPAKSSATAPLHALFWKTHPRHVSARVILSESDPYNEPPVLQLIAFGENGIEVQETGISFLSNKGKGRAFPEEIIRAEEDVGGEAGFLGIGGNWDRLDQVFNGGGGLGGPQPMPSAASTFSFDSMDSTDILSHLKREEGVYGWYRKGLEDWRIFWVGGNQFRGTAGNDDD